MYVSLQDKLGLDAYIFPQPQILQFCDVQYERQDPWFTSPTDEEDERHPFKARPERVAIICTPFARATFAEFLPPQPVRLAAFQQILRGIEALHTAGFIHRDIKPSNLGIVSCSSEQISTIILDYGNAIRAVTCDPKPGSVGTIPFLAPEMEATSYGPCVDVWACGIFGLSLFVINGHSSWKHVVNARSKYDATLAGLKEQSPDSIENLLGQMLAWDPAERVSAGSALGHSCFSALSRTDQAPTQSGQKRGRSPDKSTSCRQ